MNKDRLREDYRRAKRRLLLLDYDGVLAPIMPLPEQAAPSGQARDLLARLAADGRNTCVVISGRDRETLEAWLGDLPLAFVAEHGSWRREANGTWQETPATASPGWKAEVRSLMQPYADASDGIFMEEKTAGVGMHYRTARNQAAAEARMRELAEKLEPLAKRMALRILRGKKVVEVIPEATGKGVAARYWLDGGGWPFVLAAGDDVTDEALFQELPQTAWSVKIGVGETLARQRIGTQAEFMRLLESLVVL